MKHMSIHRKFLIEYIKHHGCDDVFPDEVGREEEVTEYLQQSTRQFWNSCSKILDDGSCGCDSPNGMSPTDWLSGDWEHKK